MRNLVLIFTFVFISCNQKHDISKTEVSYGKTSTQDSIQNLEKKNEIKKFSINTIYNENDSDFSDVQVNYNIGKFVFDKDYNEFIVDSTLDVEVKYQTLKDYSLDEHTDDKNIIRLSNYVFSLQKDNGVLFIGLFERVEKHNWKCIDIKELEKYAELGECNYILGDGKVFSYVCKTEKGNSCFAVVIDKENSAGKYDKILKAIKFDLVNGKIIEIDLKKEKVECFPEVGDE